MAGSPSSLESEPASLPTDSSRSPEGESMYSSACSPRAKRQHDTGACNTTAARQPPPPTGQPPPPPRRQQARFLAVASESPVRLQSRRQHW
eukprot:2692958-Rhodomonas_salina.1